MPPGFSLLPSRIKVKCFSVALRAFQPSPSCYPSFISPCYKCTPCILATLLTLQPSEPWSTAFSAHLWMAARLPGPSIPPPKCSALLWITRALCSLNTKMQTYVCPIPASLLNAESRGVMPYPYPHWRVSIVREALLLLRLWEVGHTSPSSSWADPPEDLNMGT